MPAIRLDEVILTWQAEVTSIPTAKRKDDPISEFTENGLHLMELFRPVFPLLRFEEQEEKVMSWPLTAHGSLTDAQTRHLLLQFTTVAARNAGLIFVLANQKQRHSVIRSVKSQRAQRRARPMNEAW